MDDGYDPAFEALMASARRIRKAGRAGRGCVITAVECELLMDYDLPCTADDPDVVGR